MLERIIGRMIDVNFHLITENGHPPPDDYFGSFLKLADLGILDRAFAERLAPSAGPRSRLVHELVHEYDEIDPAKVFESLARAELDIVMYATAIQRYISTVKP